MKVLWLCCSVLLLLCLAESVDNGLGMTPQMGWNSWNKFACNINETLIRKTADLLVQTGLAEKGYKYLNLDDCWQVLNFLIVDRQRWENSRNFSWCWQVSLRHGSLGRLCSWERTQIRALQRCRREDMWGKAWRIWIRENRCKYLRQMGSRLSQIR